MADVDVCIIKGEDDYVEPLIDGKCVVVVSRLSRWVIIQNEQQNSQPARSRMAGVNLIWFLVLGTLLCCKLCFTWTEVARYTCKFCWFVLSHLCCLFHGRAPFNSQKPLQVCRHYEHIWGWQAQRSGKKDVVNLLVLALHYGGADNERQLAGLPAGDKPASHLAKPFLLLDWLGTGGASSYMEQKKGTGPLQELSDMGTKEKTLTTPFLTITQPNEC